MVLLDDPPVLTFSHSGTVSYTEKSGKMALDAGVTITDQDSASITELEVKISSGMEAGRDLLELNQVVSSLTAADGSRLRNRCRGIKAPTRGSSMAVA